MVAKQKHFQQLQSSVSNKKQKHSNRKKLEICQAAASRTLRGDGCNPFLPALPTHESIQLSNPNHDQCQRGHPYGVLPFGNLYTSNIPDCRQSIGIANQISIRCLNDEQMLGIMGYLNGIDLAQLIQTCRYFYVMGHYPDLWRDLMLRSNKTITFFKESWRDTFVSFHYKDHPHTPISMQGFYSDVLYRPYLCSSFYFDPTQLLSNNNHPTISFIPRVDNRTLDPTYFLQTYEQTNQPCIITHVTQNWPAYQKWKNPNYFMDHIPHDTVFRATSAAAPLPASFTLKAYFQYCSTFASSNIKEEAPLYLFDRTFDIKAPHLLQDYQPHLYQSCPYFNPNIDQHQHDLFHTLGKNKRPDHRWMIMGPSQNHSGSAFHIDPNATHAWNAPLSSSKYWIFYPPGISPPGIHPSPNGDDVAMPISLGEWFLTYWDQHVQQRTNPNPNKRPIEGIAHPGDILFVPHGWWHLVLNLEIKPNPTNVSIALTQNYVSERNLSDVFRFLKMKQPQISGCRDRMDAIPPDRLYDEFSKQIRKRDPILWGKAIHASNTGWMCHAWKDDDTITKKSKSVVERSKLIPNDAFETEFKFSFL